MRLNFTQSSFNLSTAAAIIIVVFSSLFLGGVLMYTFSRSVHNNKEQNINIEVANNSLIQVSQVKIRFSQIIKDVDQSIINVYNFLYTGDIRLQTESVRAWDKTILPEIHKLEQDLSTIDNDEFKVRFNLLYDQVLYNRNIQLEIFKNDPEKMDELANMLNESSLKIASSYNTFISVTDKEKLDTFYDVQLLDDTNRVILVVVIILLLLSAYFSYIYLKNSFREVIKTLESHVLMLRDGAIPTKELKLEYKELRKLVKALNFITKKLDDIKRYAIEIGNGNFKTESVDFQTEGEINKALIRMKTSILKVAEEDEKRNRINEGLAKFSEILGNYTNNLQRFGDEVILNLVKFLNANQGCLFVVNDENVSDPYLQLISTYANNKKKYLEGRVIKGQGLIGQAWIEGKSIYMTKVPKNYVNITSGLGFSTPRSVLIIPLKFNDEIHGVIELASFSELQEYELDFVEKVSENIASALSSVKINSRTQDLLRQYEALTEKLQNHENEVVEKVNEMKEIQKEAQLREEQHLSEIRRLKKRLEVYEMHF